MTVVRPCSSAKRNVDSISSVGGIYHYGLRAPDGGTMRGKFVYREILRPERIVLVNSFSDEAGNLTRHPTSPTWL